VLGGGFQYPEDRATVALLPYGDEPYQGGPSVGFRIVRSGGGSPPASQSIGSVPSWTIIQDQVIAGSGSQDPQVVAATMSNRIDGNHRYGQEGDPDYEDDNVGFMRADDAFVRMTPYYMSKGEITFAQWKEVFQWAVHNGYTFDHDGDLGSMDWQTGEHTHAPNDPHR
jgi:hypothetical protein